MACLVVVRVWLCLYLRTKPRYRTQGEAKLVTLSLSLSPPLAQMWTRSLP